MHKENDPDNHGKTPAKQADPKFDIDNPSTLSLHNEMTEAGSNEIGWRGRLSLII